MTDLPDILRWKLEAEQMRASAEIEAQSMDGANPCDFPDWVCATRILSLISILEPVVQFTPAEPLKEHIISS